MVLQLESWLKAVALHANRSWRVKRKGKPGVILKLGVRIAIKLPFSLSPVYPVTRHFVTPYFHGLNLDSRNDVSWLWLRCTENLTTPHHSRMHV